MKKFIIFKSLTILLIVFGFTLSQGQNPTLTINYNGTGLVPGDYVYIPIVLTGTEVGNWRILIRYDRDVLSFTETTWTLPTPSISGLVGSGDWLITSGPNIGEVALAVGFTYTGPAPGYTINQAVATMKFLFNGGQTNLSIINKFVGTSTSNDSYVRALPYKQVNMLTTFTDGSVSGGFGTLTSVVGGGDWKTAATWVENKVPSKAYNVFITGSTVTDTTTTGRCNNLTINAGGKLTVEAGKSLAVKGNMLIKSDATSTGSFIDAGTGTTVTGSTSVERYTTGNLDGGWPKPALITWHYVSSPVSGGTIASYMGSLLNYWNEPANTWSPMTLPLTTPLLPNKGYAAATTSNQVITFTGGILNTADQNVTGLTRTGAGLYSGFNLIGNPYPSALQWNAAVVDRTNIGSSAYLWNGSTYLTFTTSDGYVIPAEQGFGVMVNSGFTSGSITLRNASRAHSVSSYLKNSPVEKLSLKVNGNNLEDFTSIRFNTEATEGFDNEFDAYKIWGISACPQIYTMTTDDNLSINSLPEMTTQTVIPVGFMAGANDTYSITASGLESFSPGTDIYLEDLLLNKTQNLNTNPVYEFTVTAGTGTHRFNIHFSPLSGISEGTSSNIKIYAAENTVFVNIPMELHGTIFVYDLLGKEIITMPIQSNNLNKINLNVELGYYLIKVLGDKATASGKVFIR